MRYVISKRELWPKKLIFLCQKHQNQPSFQKVTLPVAHGFGGSGQNCDLFEIVALTTDTIAKHLPSN
jgi:hypothetical protein